MVGGVIALRILGLFVFQPLDLLTMIGFIIVLGLVVNNTILLVARTRQAEAEGMSRVDAVRSSLETRLQADLLEHPDGRLRHASPCAHSRPWR